MQLKSEGIGFRLSGVNEDVRALTLALAVARERHARTDQLLQVKGASIEEFRREEAEIAGLSAKLSAAQNSVLTLHKEQEAVQQNMAGLDALLSYATLLAPVSGTLSQRMVSAGDLAMPGKPLLRIAANHGLYLNLSLPVGVQPKEILYHGKKIPLTPKHQATPSGLAQYLAPLPAQSAVTEGQFLSVRVVIYDADDVLVPVDGLLSIGSKSFVFTMVDNQAWKEEVVIKGRGSEGVVVAADLAGKRIIVAKPDILLRVSSGVPVHTIDGAQNPSTAADNQQDKEEGSR